MAVSESLNVSTATAMTALRDLLVSVGLSVDENRKVSFEGADPVLPSRFLLGTAGAVALAAVGVGVADIHMLRGGAPLDIAVSLAAAAASLRSSSYLRVNDMPPPNPWDPIAGFYLARDGRHIQLHTNFPHHRDGTVQLLGARNDRDAVGAAIAGRDAFALEDDMAAAGLCAAVARTREEWQRHMQFQAIAAAPLIDIEKCGDSAPEPFAHRSIRGPVRRNGSNDATRPLRGIRVLDLTRVLAGPTCGRALAEHGAEVLAIASPRLPNLPFVVLDTNHGKYSAHLDLDDAEDLITLQQLVRGAEVFSQSYRPGALAKRGFSVTELHALRPGIVCVDLCAYGHVGPWSMRRGYDTLVQSASGIALEQGEGVNPQHLPCSALDYITGYLGAFGALIALARRAREGGSYRVRVSLAQTARWLDGLGRITGEMSGTKNIAPDVTSLMQDGDSPAGRLRFLGPVLRLRGARSGWRFPAVPTGTHAAAWRDC